MSTLDYRSKTLFAERDNGIVENYWPMAIDIGYGGCKIYGPNICAAFPSYAKRIDISSFLGDLATDDILYTDLDAGVTWLVGRSAQNMMQDTDTDDSIDTLCGRNRYFSPLFLVLARVSMGIAMLNTVNSTHLLTDKVTPVLQTGLPCKYIDGDSPLIKDALAGHHRYMIKIGNGKEYCFDFTLPPENINKIMQQPMGAFISAATDKNWIQNIALFSTANVLIVDPGFYTFDTFSVRGRVVDSKESWSEYSMSRILKETSKEIFEKYGTEIPPSNMQKYLETGKFTRFDRKNRKTESVDFENILNSNSRTLCEQAMNKVCDVYNNLLDYKYLIITGGTGAAWAYWITDMFKGMSTLNVIAGDCPDGMPMYFANVRGYYSYLKQYLYSLNLQRK